MQLGWSPLYNMVTKSKASRQKQNMIIYRKYEFSAIWQEKWLIPIFYMLEKNPSIFIYS